MEWGGLVGVPQGPLEKEWEGEWKPYWSVGGLVDLQKSGGEGGEDRKVGLGITRT